MALLPDILLRLVGWTVSCWRSMLVLVIPGCLGICARSVGDSVEMPLSNVSR